jgi:hypothetical protein
VDPRLWSKGVSIGVEALDWRNCESLFGTVDLGLGFNEDVLSLSWCAWGEEVIWLVRTNRMAVVTQVMGDKVAGFL